MRLLTSYGDWTPKPQMIQLSIVTDYPDYYVKVLKTKQGMLHM